MAILAYQNRKISPMLQRFAFIAILSFFFLPLQAQQSQLSVQKIMQDPKWIGNFPENVRWGIHSENIYFQYNPEGNVADSLYKIAIQDPQKIIKVSSEESKNMISTYGDFSKDRMQMVYTNDGSLYIYHMEDRSRKELLKLPFRISNPEFAALDNEILFLAEDNVFTYSLKNGTLKQLTNIKPGSRKAEAKDDLNTKDQWLQDENLALLQVVRERKENRDATKNYREATRDPERFAFYLEEKNLSNLVVAPNAKYATFSIIDRKSSKNTGVPNYVDESGYTKDLSARSKVGDLSYTAALALYQIEKDTVITFDFSTLPGISKLPDYIKDYPKKEWKEEPRPLIPSTVKFSPQGDKAVVNLRSTDNKDRWIVAIDLETGKLETLDHQRDEAWLAGPGIGYTYYGYETMGWLPDNKHIYFQTEESGYSHLVILNTQTGKKKDLTPGEYEVFDPVISNDGRHWFFTSSKVHAGERHFYKMPLMGGSMEQLTSMTGNNAVSLSPDEAHMAITYSFMNRPEELFLKQTSGKHQAVQLTNGRSKAFMQYDWREPQLIQFDAQDGAKVPARLYLPEEDVKNNAAVVFVHGAGYLQNVHNWWSSYFREYMFHNLLTDLGYTVIDIDYRGSAGYGRDWRTGIYRHMGGKDLSDQVDGVQYLIKEHGIDPQKVGIYGGSYGGFITLMALFTEAETFQAGAALRSVTDWAHYNHGYTSNILNEPSQDPIAYKRSSPIYFAEGLKGDLLIAHGMVDVNVHFQDVVRLSQRLIELGKENWELAVYPVEDHGFVEPSSWTDEYRRILDLFNENLLDK